MSGGRVFYNQRRLFKKNWQRHLFGFTCCTVTLSISYYLQTLAYNRYNSFRGKSVLYGTEPLEGGTWKKADSEQQDGF